MLFRFLCNLWLPANAPYLDRERSSPYGKLIPSSTLRTRLTCLIRSSRLLVWYYISWNFTFISYFFTLWVKIIVLFIMIVKTDFLPRVFQSLASRFAWSSFALQEKSTSRLPSILALATDRDWRQAISCGHPKAFTILRMLTQTLHLSMRICSWQQIRA